MFENVRATLSGASIACWVLAAIFTVVILRTRLTPQIRQAFRRIAWVYTAGLAVIQIILLTRAHAGVILPGWFYACILVGILAPWVIALHAAGIEKEATH
jgi:hypothetical protein